SQSADRPPVALGGCIRALEAGRVPGAGQSVATTVHAFDARNGSEGSGVRPRFGLRPRAISEVLEGRFAGIAGAVVHAAGAFTTAVGADGHNGNGAADCVREPSKSPAGASDREAERDCGAAGDWGEPGEIGRASCRERGWSGVVGG